MSHDDHAWRDSTVTEAGSAAWVSTRRGSVGMHRVTLRDGETCAEATPSPGSTANVAGRYEILGEIARGGMGAVLRGRDADLNRDLAVKVLLEHHRDRPEMLRRFLEEAQIGGQLQHPGIVPVYEMGTFSDERPYFAMKLVKGQTLAELLRARTTAEEDRARFIVIFEQVCQTVAYAHSRGVIHRDLKPLNIMVGAFGEVQVMDWGLAKVLGTGGREEVSPEPQASLIRTARSDSSLDQTVAGLVLGTPAYMAAEQARGDVDGVDERADVFGLGAILCEILTGKPPYTGRTAAVILMKAESADLADAWSRLDAAVADPELIALAKSCLAADPRDRPRDAGAVARALTGYLTSIQSRLRAAELASVEAQGRAETERTRRKFTVAIAGLLVACVAILGVGWAAFRHYRDSRIEATDRAVHAAMERALALREEARQKGVGDLAAWDRAEQAAEKILDILSGRIARPELVARVNDFTNDVLRDAGRARRCAAKDAADRALVLALENVYLEHADGSPSADPLPAHYAAAFRAAGIDVERLSPEASIDALKGRSETARIAADLDDWARRLPDATSREKLERIARSIDPDPFRNRVRDATISRDRGALLAMAGAPDSGRLPALSADLLANELARLGENASATEVLTHAQRRFPADFWINYDLGMLHLRADTPRPDDAIRFLTTAVALKRDSPGALVSLGHALAFKESHEEATATFREAIRLRPDFAPALSRLQARARRAAPGPSSALRRLQADPSLAPFRDPASLAKLPDRERAAWKGLWADVDKLVNESRD